MDIKFLNCNGYKHGQIIKLHDFTDMFYQSCNLWV